jgi:hypothetical protein
MREKAAWFLVIHVVLSEKLAGGFNKRLDKVRYWKCLDRTHIILGVI